MMWFISAASSLPAPTGLMVEHMVASEAMVEDASTARPIFIGTPTPRFSWRLTPANASMGQEAFQLQVLAADQKTVWDSGRVESNRSSLVKYGEDAQQLVSDSGYTWRVRWWSDDVAGAPSDWAAAGFRTALFDDAAWGAAEQIRCATVVACLYLRTEFSLPANETIEHATVFVGGMGWIETWLDGSKLGANAVLEPGWSQWDARILYTAHDVTEALAAKGSGASALGLVLGNGWPGHLQHHPTGKLLLRVRMRSGMIVEHASNARDWMGSSGPITGDDIYNGEQYDARREVPGWASPGLDTRSWDRVQVYADASLKQSVMTFQDMRPIRAFQLLEPVASWALGPNRTVFDFGQNLAGWLRIEWGSSGPACPAGTVITLRHAEFVNSTDHMSAGGELEVANLRKAAATDTYTCDGRKAAFAYEPRFTYHGFRFAEVSGVQPVGWTVSARVVHSDVSYSGNTSAAIGTFDVRAGEDSGLVNAIMRACEWTQRDNLHSVPTDCPQRDERQGWMGDASVSSEGAMHYFWMPAFYKSWLRSMRDVQDVVALENDCKESNSYPWGSNCTGTVADTVPHMPGLFGSRPPDPSWGVALPLIMENVLRYYGDHHFAASMYPAVAAYVDWQIHVAENSSNGIVDYQFYGDWLQPGRVASAENVSRMLSGFNFLQGLRIAADTAAALGREQDAHRYMATFERFKAQFHRVYFVNGTYLDGSQSALVMAAYIEAPPTPAIANATFSQLLRAIEGNGGRLNTGIIMTKWLMELLSMRGRSDVALSLVVQTDYPSWGYMIENGATTVWEHWNAYDNPSGPIMNSHNHPAFTSVGAWLYRWLAGIRLGGYGTGYQEVVFAPSVVDNPSVAALDASIESSFGRVGIQWSYRASNQTLTLTTSLPSNTRGTVVLPKANGFQAPQAVSVFDQAGAPIMRWPSESTCVRAVCGPHDSAATGHVTFELRGGGSRRFVAIYE